MNNFKSLTLMSIIVSSVVATALLSTLVTTAEDAQAQGRNIDKALNSLDSVVDKMKSKINDAQKKVQDKLGNNDDVDEPINNP